MIVTLSAVASFLVLAVSDVERTLSQQERLSEPRLLPPARQTTVVAPVRGRPEPVNPRPAARTSAQKSGLPRLDVKRCRVPGGTLRVPRSSPCPRRISLPGGIQRLPSSPAASSPRPSGSVQTVQGGAAAPAEKQVKPESPP